MQIFTDDALSYWWKRNVTSNVERKLIDSLTDSAAATSTMQRKFQNLISASIMFQFWQITRRFKTLFWFQNLYRSLYYYKRCENIVQRLQLMRTFDVHFQLSHKKKSIIAFEHVNKSIYNLNWWLIEVYVSIDQLIKILNFRLFANNVHFVNYSSYQ